MNTLLQSRLQIFVLFIVILISSISYAQTEYKEYKGTVVNSKNNKALESVSLNVDKTNINTITNSDGEFVIKVPIEYLNSDVIVSLLGFKTIVLPLSQLTDNSKIELNQAVTELTAVNISAYKDAGNLVKKVFENKSETLKNESVFMTGFYRETIKRRNRNVSLTEAVVNIVKQPYTSGQRDIIGLNKARKSTDYKRLDTVSVKLQGGPFSTIYLDIMKYPEYIFTEETITAYDFSFDAPSIVNNRNVYVVNFKPKKSTLNINYKGTLYIDEASLALVSAKYAIDLSNESKTKNLLVKKKPRDVEVYPLEANYHVDYKERGGKWYYSYANLDLTFKVKKKRQLFNKVYTLASELAITDWTVNSGKRDIKNKDRLKPSVIITDAILGFSDPDFWGEYNLIEPDKSIETAINKIKKSIEKQQQKEREKENKANG